MKMPNMKVELRFVPEMLITLNDETLGRVTFKNVKTMGEFIKSLRMSLSVLIKEFEAKERVAEGERKLNEKRKKES